MRQKGFAEVVFIIIVVVILIVGIFYNGSKNNINQLSAPLPTRATVTATRSPTPRTLAIPTKTSQLKNWNIFEMPKEKLKINYPDNWVLTEVEGQNLFTLTSPNNFKLYFRSGLDGLGGGCDEECQSKNIKNVVLDTLNFYDLPLYIVVNGLKEDTVWGKAHIGFNVIPQKNCWSNVCYGFDGKNSEGTVIINGGYSPDKTVNLAENPGQSVYMTSEEFSASNDVKVALSILKKLSY